MPTRPRAWLLLPCRPRRDRSIDTDALRPGITYQLRFRRRTTTLGGFVLGATDTVAFTVP